MVDEKTTGRLSAEEYYEMIEHTGYFLVGVATGAIIIFIAWMVI